MIALVSSIVLADQLPEEGMIESAPTPRNRLYTQLEEKHA